MLLGDQTTEFHMYEYLPFCPLRRTALVSVFQSFAYSQATPFRPMRLARLIKEQKAVGGRLGRVLLQSSSRKFQHVTCVLGGLAWVSAEQLR